MSETTLRSSLELTEEQREALMLVAMKSMPTSPVKRVDRRRKRVQRMSDSDLMKRFNVEAIAAEISEAAETLKHHHSGRCWPAEMRAVWPDVVQSTYESYNTDKARADLAERTRIVPSSAEITRMDRAIGWLNWLEPRQRIIVWAMASGLSLRKVAAMHGKGRTSIHEDYVASLVLIAIHLHDVSRQQGKPTIAKIK
jgi:hypothetical protein